MAKRRVPVVEETVLGVALLTCPCRGLPRDGFPTALVTGLLKLFLVQ